ncbi:peptidase associated/transthyretin-like domain-containing protein [Winogradskyella sp.]
MKSIVFTVLSVVICILLISSSNSPENTTDQNEDTNTLTEYLGQPININLKGTVANHLNEPLDSVTITIGNQSIQTDAQGHFEIKSAIAHDNFLPVEAHRKGYQNMVINLNPKDKKNDIDITLKKEGTTCLFWFCRHNHNLPISTN